jgi:hypothetical protein
MPMPAWVDTPTEEKAWQKAKSIVEKQRNKSEDDFTDRDWGLVTHIAQNILKSSVRSDIVPWASRAEETGILLARVNTMLHNRKRSASVSPEAQEILAALAEVASASSEAIHQLRTRNAQPNRYLARELRHTASKIRSSFRR